MVEFKPKYIAFDPSAANGVVVRFSWGGPVGWALVIGPPTASTPGAVGIESNDPQVRSVRRVKPGAYIIVCTG
jgi:hypothetical protein